jgi:hypothetical protein
MPQLRGKRNCVSLVIEYSPFPAGLILSEHTPERQAVFEPEFLLYKENRQENDPNSDRDCVKAEAVA